MMFFTPFPMQSLFLKLVDHCNNNNIALTLLFFAVAAYVLIWAGRAIEKSIRTTSRLDKVEGKIDGLEGKFDKLESKFDLLMANFLPRKFVKSHSPLALASEGIKIASDIGAAGIFAKHAERLSSIVERSNPQTPYDIQLSAMTVARNDLEPLLEIQELNAIKDAAFKEGVLMDNIWMIFAIMLRDHILKKRGIAISEVDKHDPHKSA